MSKDVDRAQVLKTNKVRTALKTDGSWIHKSKQEKERTEGAAESGYIPGKNTSFVSSAAKKFDRSAASTDSTLNPTLKKTQWSPSKGDSVTTGNIKALAGENKLDPTTVAENREAHAATPLDHSQPAEASAPSAVEVKSKETSGADSGKATDLAPAVLKPTEPHAKESCKTIPPKTVEAKANLEVNPSPETPAVGSTKQSQSSAPHSVPNTVSKPPRQSDDTQAKALIDGNSLVANKDPSAVTSEVAVGLKAEDPPIITKPVNATEPTANESCKTFSPTQVVAKTVEAKANVEVNPSPETPAVGSTKQSQSSATHPVPNTVSKPPRQSDDTQAKALIDGNSLVANKDPSAVTSEVAVGLKAEYPPVIIKPVNATEPPANYADTHQNTDPVKVPAQDAVGLKAVEPPVIIKPAKATEPPAKEICKTFPPTQFVAKTPDVKTAPQNGVVPVSHMVSKTPTESAADTTVKSAEPKVKFAVPAEPLVKTTPEQAAESEALPAKNITEQHSLKPVSVNMVEVSIKEAVAPVTASEGGAAEDASGQPIELSDALVEEPPTAQSVPEPVNDVNQSFSNRSDDTTSKEKFQKPNEELQSYYAGKKTRHGKAVCSFCDQAIDGNVKITFSDPPVTCHSECLKCGVCAKDLGDLLTPIYLHDQVFYCKNCFVKAVKT